jgi:predicted nucleotide-binding protein
MKDSELRGKMLAVFYDRRHNNDGWVPTSEMDFGAMIDRRMVGSIGGQLADASLIRWKPLTGAAEGFVVGMGQITAFGVDVVEGTRRSPINIDLPGKPMPPPLPAIIGENPNDTPPTEEKDTMSATLSELKSYEERLTAILSRFNHTRDGIHIKREDDAPFRQYVRELIDLLNDVLGRNNYSGQIAVEFNEGVSNFIGSPSYKSVENIISIVRAVQTRLARNPPTLSRNNASEVKMSRKIFIVHGHSGIEESIARFITQIGLEPVILHEQPNQGRTIIEKFENYSDVGFAVVLLTPDDVGGPRDGAQQARARQNVILELGYFIGHLGRGQVCALVRGNIELPSDILGVVWEALDEHGAWRTKLARELRAAGYEFDWSKIAG